MSHVDLELLIRQAKDQDQFAIEQLFGFVRPWLREEFGYMFRSCGLPFADGSDVAQETCIKAARVFHEFPGSRVSDLYRWLRGIARNCSADLQRYEAAAIRNIRRRVSGSEVMASLVAEGGSVSESLARDEEAAKLMAVLPQLSIEEQDVLRQRFFEQMSFEEIAADRGEKAGTVRQRCLRALAKMRNLMEK